MSDLIERQAAIDSICRTVCDNPEICESPCDEIKVLEIMPSAQPDVPDTNVGDIISRQAAIDACIRVQEHHAYDEIEEIKALPSTQPEPDECVCCEYRVGDLCCYAEVHDAEPCEDVVSRQAVYNVLDKMPVRGFKKDGETIHGLISLSQVNSAIINLPSVRPGIIRCKDCKHWTKYEFFCSVHVLSPMQANDYCSRAERRTDEHSN